MKRTLFCLAAFVLAFTACSEFDEPERITETDEVIASSTATTATQTRAGAANVFEQMDNPYSLALMRQLKNNPSLQPTHLYVRFLPADSAQLNALEDNLDLDLFDYPLDVNIEDDEIYVDPTIPEGQITWQYAAVPANFSFPSGIRKEILQQCYIPADEEEAPPATRTGGESNLERLAILACGYELLPETRTNGDKYPDGKVEVLDNSLNKNVPVKGVRVKCHYFLKVGKDNTDANGYYSINKKFHVKPKYTVVFKNEMGFIIWDQVGISCRAKYHVPSRQSADGYDILIEPDLVGKPSPSSSLTRVYDRSWQEAAVNNGAYDYYAMCKKTGISEPPKGLRILVHPSMGNSAPMMRRMSVAQPLTKANWATFLGAGTGLTIPVTIIDGLFKFLEPDITINGEIGDKDYRSFYESINHELSHASHFQKAGSRFWSRYISHVVDNLGYGGATGPFSGNCQVGEMWGYAMGHIMDCEEHEKNRLQRPYSLSRNDYARPIGDNNHWISPDPIWALLTRGILEKKQIFECLVEEVDTVDKLINKLCLNKTAEVANAIRIAFAHNDVPSITGNNPSGLNVNAKYSVPTATNMANGFIFNGWTVSPSTYTSTSGLGNRDLNIKFTAYGTYTITANFTLPNGTNYSLTKTVSMTPPAPPAPGIFSNKTNVKEGDSVTFSVTSNMSAGDTYQWDIDGSIMSGGSSISVIPARPNGGGINPYALMPGQGDWYMNVRCRTIRGGVASAWSNQVSVLVRSNGVKNPSPVTY